MLLGADAGAAEALAEAELAEAEAAEALADAELAEADAALADVALAEAEEAEAPAEAEALLDALPEPDAQPVAITSAHAHAETVSASFRKRDDVMGTPPFHR